MNNRLANTKNMYQGDRKKVLCVCSAGLLRSPTIAWILSNPPFDFNTRACGTSDEYALIPIDKALVYWADEIVCVNEWQAKRVKELNYSEEEKPIHVIETPDAFGFRDDALVKLLTPKLEEVFNV